MLPRQAFLRGETTGQKYIQGRGGRLTVAHIVSEDGFLKDLKDISKDVRLVFQAKKKRRFGETDYHDKMLGACFEEWLGFVLLMFSRNYIVIDNTSYFHRQQRSVLLKTGRKQEYLR